MDGLSRTPRKLEKNALLKRAMFGRSVFIYVGIVPLIGAVLGGVKRDKAGMILTTHSERYRMTQFSFFVFARYGNRSSVCPHRPVDMGHMRLKNP